MFRILGQSISLLSIALNVAIATEHNTPSNLNIECNKNGAEITILNTGIFVRGTKLYLGKDCDAFLPEIGSGNWWFAASAFVVEISGNSYRFANEIDCPTLPACWSTN